ncbi:MAG: endonuclease/exonuclease/phosphatase family protein [Anaerolineales bacterium]|nr:endonuclease/exonuclease/phosphatase family protein [Anaerolineales bacterium]
MDTATRTNQRILSNSILFAILYLFFFQILADFMEAVYAYGLLGTGIPTEIVSVLFLFSPLVLLFFKNGFSNLTLLFFAGLFLLARLLEAMLDIRGQMLVAGVGVASFLILFPAIIYRFSHNRNPFREVGLGIGLIIAVALSILFRVLNSGTDISTTGWFQIIGWILAGVAFVLLALELLSQNEVKETGIRGMHASFGKSTGLILGIVASFTLLYFSFTAPNVISRWTEFNYLLLVVLIVLSLSGFAYILAFRKSITEVLRPSIVMIWNLLFLIFLILSIIPHQIRFPLDPAVYPIFEPQLPQLAILPVILMLLSFPVIFVNFIVFIRELIALKPSFRDLGGGFLIGSLFLLIMIFAHVFTTVYDYIPLVGPFFRDKFWLVYLTVGIVMVLPLLLAQERAFTFTSPPIPGEFVKTIALIGAFSIVGVFLTMAKPFPPADQSRPLRVLTYNIQQGFSDFGEKNFDGQLELIKEIDADLIGLQESDNNRISGGNSDIVRYFADNLHMYSYYGPKPVTGTFGIALLSRYPIENPKTFYMFSEGEQTATIHAQITVADKTYNVFVTHLGNGGPIIQQEAILEEVEGKNNLILMGDFNFRPDTSQYQLTLDYLQDAWLMRWPDGIDDQDINPINRIDHFFVSSEIQVIDVRYIFSPASDHPAVWADMR